MAVGFLNPIAEMEFPDSGKFVLPDEAMLIKGNIKFFCPDYDCKDPNRLLFIKRSPIGNLFFSHRPECGHDIKPETLLHKMAIEWFLSITRYEIPPGDSINGKRLVIQEVNLNPSLTIPEFRIYKEIRPDIKFTTDKGFEFAIEIVVSNDISPKKLQLLHKLGLSTIRVDLSNFFNENAQSCRTDIDFIKKRLPQLLTNPNLKSWVKRPNYELTYNKLVYQEVVTVQDSGIGCLLTVLSGVILICAIIFL
jgi:hypothetical protein